MANGLTKITKEDADIQALRVNKTVLHTKRRECVGWSIGRGYEADYLEGIMVSDGMRYQKWLQDSASTVTTEKT